MKPPLLLLLLVALTGGCRHDKDAEGPAERAGRHVDHAAENTERALGKAAEKTDEAAHKAVRATGNAFEKAGQKLNGSDSRPASSAAPKSDK